MSEYYIYPTVDFGVVMEIMNSYFYYSLSLDEYTMLHVDEPNVIGMMDKMVND